MAKMCSSDFGTYEYQFEKDDMFGVYDDSLENALFCENIGNSERTSVKQEQADNMWTESNNFDDEDMFDIDNYLDSSMLSAVCQPLQNGEEPNLKIESLPDFVGLPFNDVLDDATSKFDSSASDSGLSTDNNGDLQFPFGLASPETTGVASPDTLDAVSDVSSTSDLGSMGSVVSSPAGSNGQGPPLLLDFSPTQNISKSNFVEESNRDKLIFIPASSQNIVTPGPNGTALKLLEFSNAKTRNIHSISVKPLAQQKTSWLGSNTVQLTKSIPSVPSTTLPNGQTIVLTQAGKASQVPRNGVFIKNIGKNSIFQLLPANQIKTIKVITAGNGTVRTLISPVRPAAGVAAAQTNTVARTVLSSSKTFDGRPILKVGPITPILGSPVSAPTARYVTPSVTVKEEPIMCDDEDDEIPQNGQELLLTEEEKRLLKKEQIALPSHYPLTKQEERDLKRIRRKIRNKISAQDSRKRKKEYVDGLEDRVKHCSDENQKLQKRIRHLESQNETLSAHLKRFQQLVGTGVPARSQSHTSTALMMLILSAALIVVPSLRPQDAREGDLTNSVNVPPPGQTRNLLEAGTSVMNKQDLSSEDESVLNPEEPDFNPLSDHDYAPLAKKPRYSGYTSSYNDFPRLDKAMPGSPGEPPDGTAGLDGVSAIIGALLDRLGKNWTDPVQGDSLRGNLVNRASQSLVVNLNSRGKFMDDIELE